MNDTSIRFAESHDPDINRMSHTMRRIMAVYSSSRMELETRKLYYDRILRIMTHEMRNAITPIVSLSADMKRNPDRYKGEDLNEAVSLISDESQSIRRFLDSYYELTHLPKPQIDTIDVMEFFTGIRKSFAIYLTDNGLGADIIDYTIPVDIQLRADRDLLGRLVTNVLRNAVQAVESVESPCIHVEVSVSEGHPYISIEDNGCGIPAEIMPNLFQPFFSTKPDGSGIGLCLSRQIARLHGGDFTITSTPHPRHQGPDNIVIIVSWALRAAFNSAGCPQPRIKLGPNALWIFSLGLFACLCAAENSLRYYQTHHLSFS